jgi:2-(3-amino-3-carboxypropyl)histidine synthase
MDDIQDKKSFSHKPCYYKLNLEDVVKKIKKIGAKKVGLQFPDGLLRRSTDIKDYIENETKSLVLISENSCFGACDLDMNLLNEVDLLFHFGHSKIFDVKRVEYVEARMKCDFDDLLRDSLTFIHAKKISLVSTVQHIGDLKRIKAFYEENGIVCIIGKGDSRITYEGQVLGCNFSSAKNDGEEIIYIGSGYFHPIGIGIATKKRVLKVDPISKEIEEVKTERLIRRRYGVISKAMDFRSVGILVSSKIGQKRSDIALKLYKNALKKGYKAYILYMDTIYPEGIGIKVDLLVNTACPRIAIDDYKRFKAPILTPIEFEMLLGERSMDEYIMDEIR